MTTHAHAPCKRWGLWRIWGARHDCRPLGDQMAGLMGSAEDEAAEELRERDEPEVAAVAEGAGPDELAEAQAPGDEPEDP